MNGGERQIDAHQVVVGDVVLLELFFATISSFLVTTCSAMSPVRRESQMRSRSASSLGLELHVGPGRHRRTVMVRG